MATQAISYPQMGKKKKPEFPAALMEYFREKGRLGAKKKYANMTEAERKEVTRKATEASLAARKRKAAAKKETDS
jgi:hypothetical protein